MLRFIDDTTRLLRTPSAFGLLLVAAACGGKAVVDDFGGTGGTGGAGGAETTSGNTSGPTTDVGSSGNTVAVTDGAPLSCADLEMAYASELELAKACDPSADPIAACGYSYPADMKNCCTPRVAVSGPSEVLDGLIDGYNALGCVVPCELDCPPSLPISGFCDPMLRQCETVQGLPD